MRSDSLTARFQEIHKLVSVVRGLINKPRIQHSLLNDLPSWNKLCSSLDAVEDTTLAVESYSERRYPEDAGSRYLILFGLLQAIFVQTDALQHLADSLKIKIEVPIGIRRLREIRNDAVGHPTFRERKKASNFISRMSLSKDSFDLMTVHSVGRETKFQTIDVTEVIQEDAGTALQVLQDILTELERREQAHKEKFVSTKCAQLLSTIGYELSKIAEGVHITSPALRKLCIGHARAIEEGYLRFDDELKQRGELPANEVIALYLDKGLYAIRAIKAYFSDPEASRLNPQDAEIFTDFLRSHHDDLAGIAAEIDEQYKIESPQ